MKINLYQTIERLESYIKERNISFKEGFPVIPKELLLHELPKEILPHPHHLKAAEPHNSLICHFSQDDVLYHSLKKLDERIEIWKKFKGVCGFDFSARCGDEEVSQDLYLYLNKLFDAYVALHGIKILPNFRIAGDLSSLNVLKIYPPQCWFAVGTLGCGGNVEANSMLLRYKLIFARPKCLIIYGSLKDAYRRILEEYGVKYSVFEDFNRRCRHGNF